MEVVIAEDATLLRDGLTRLLTDRGHEVVDALERVADGGTALDPEVVSQILGRNRQAPGMAELSTRERDVLAVMAEGLSNPAIADRLVISVGAVEKHVASIFDKLDPARRAGMARPRSWLSRAQRQPPARHTPTDSASPDTPRAASRTPGLPGLSFRARRLAWPRSSEGDRQRCEPTVW